MALKDQLAKLLGGRADSGALGIEIGASSVKVIQLAADSDDVASLVTYGELQLGPYGGREAGQTAVLQPPQLAEVLSTIVREAKVTAKRAALAIPYKASFVVNVTLPTRDPQKIASMVPIEARKYVPLPMNEVTLDWFPVSSLGGEDEKTKDAAPAPEATRVLLAAIHNDTYEQYRAVVERAGLASEIVEIEAFSVLRSCLEADDANVMVFDFGASATKIHIVDDGVVQEVSHVPMGSEILSNALAAALSVDFRQAEEIKRQVGLSGGTDPRIKTTLEPLVDRVLVAGKRLLDAHERNTGRAASRVILTGGGSLLPGFVERAAEMFGREAARATPFVKMNYPEALDPTVATIGPSFATAIGVALRQLTER